MPDLIHILLYRPVRRELTGACRIQQRLLSPSRFILISLFHTLLCFRISLKVSQNKVSICPVTALCIQQ